jgi:hypothetical protein
MRDNKPLRVESVKVESMTGASGRAVPNQFLIYTSRGVYFQSYESVIAFKSLEGQIYLDAFKWDYSKTTGRYRNEFLNESKDATERKITQGIYQLTDLNK